MAVTVEFIEDRTMRTPRIRFREFLLLTAMISLITAAFAIRARTAALLSAPDHAFLAYRERANANLAEGEIEHAKRRLEQVPPVSADQAAGYDVRLMNSVTTWEEVPMTGKELVIVVDLYDTLNFRMFDGKGRIVAHVAEGGKTRNDLLERLADLWPPHELTPVEKGWIIDQCVEGNRVWRSHLQAVLRATQAEHAEAVASAAYHERLARRP
jgi:hypothetical protein